MSHVQTPVRSSVAIDPDHEEAEHALRRSLNDLVEAEGIAGKGTEP